jgi:hypothetical protein
MRTSDKVDVLLDHFEFSEIMEWCTIDQEEVLTTMIDNGWIELPPFLEIPEEDDEEAIERETSA